jgi:Zn-dependent protease
MIDDLSLIQKISIWTLPILFAITVHEVAHGWVAYKLGDDTAYRLGRITLNPIKHIDLIGTILIPGLMLVMGGIIFGWAKPVPVNFHRLRQPRRDMALVALAGPGANLLMAILWAIIAKVGVIMTNDFESAIFLLYVGGAGFSINMILMILNLLPILPLDGGRVFHSVLPPDLAESYGKLEAFGLVILIVLLVSGVLEKIMNPLMSFMSQPFFWLLGL